METDVDLIVAGAGGGLAGALRAAELGARVLVVEANPHYRNGNNTSMSTAMIPGAGTRWQQAQQLEDSPQRFVEDMQRKTHGTVELGLAQALAQISGELVTWLADFVGLPIELTTDFAYPGHSTLRCHTIPQRTGSKLLDGLLTKAAELENLDLMAPARIIDVAGNPERRIAIIETPDGTHEAITTRGILLATNGFGANPAMIKLHIPEMVKAYYHGSVESKGDALQIGTRLGADSAFLNAYQGHAALSYPYATLVGWATVLHGGVLVNLEGERFGDETIGYSEFGHMELMQPQQAGILIFDRAIHDACMLFEDFQHTVAAGAVRSAQSPESLAQSFGLPVDRLTNTLEAVDSFANGVDQCPFGRTSWPRRLDQSALMGVRVTAALFHTQGGLRVNRHAQVLRRDRSAIGGLYASGGAAMGISGYGASGYLAGNGLLPALGLAYLAAQDVTDQR